MMQPIGQAREALQQRDRWVQRHLIGPEAELPFSFLFEGRPSGTLLPGWQRTQHAEAGTLRARHDLTWRDSATGLEVTCAAVTYVDHPAVEWTLHFRNTDSQPTPILEDIQALATCRQVGQDEAATLYRSRGSLCSERDFEYLAEPIGRGEAVRMAAGGGRSSNHWLPFFNLQVGRGGTLIALGWTGQWAAEFSRSREGDVRARAGMEKTHLSLRPGERIRSPRMLLLFWQDDRLTGHNALRRFILEHNTPRPGGEALVGPLSVGHWGGMSSAEHRDRVAVYASEQLTYDYYWMDAGWYGPDSGPSPDEFTGDWWKHVGDWTVNPKVHPNGLRPISDGANAAGMKFLVWFEPERAIDGTPLTVERPEWFLGERTEGGSLLFDLGNPEAREWLAEYIAGLIETHGVGLYRQDFNVDPLPYWRAADAPDRQGMTEIRHVEGLYAFWDALLERFPRLVIDNCASGGRRIDLETIRRSIPLWRSDWQCRADNDPIGGQVHGMGLSWWVPLHGTGTWGARLGESSEIVRTYRCRSNMGPAFQFSLWPYEYTPIRDDYPFDWHRRMLDQYRRIRPMFRGDYYPLTDTSPSSSAWAAYQMHRGDLDEGFVMAFRRPEAPYRVADFRLRGLDERATYELTDVDAGTARTHTGRELMETGLTVEMQSRPCSALFVYARRKEK